MTTEPQDKSEQITPPEFTPSLRAAGQVTHIRKVPVERTWKGAPLTVGCNWTANFWPRYYPDTKVTGIVTFSPSEGAALSLIGTFTDIMNKVDRRPSPDYRRIVGETVRGNLTLDDCHLTFEDPFHGRQRFVAICRYFADRLPNLRHPGSH